MKLLTIGDAKTSKGESLGILTGILYLNPAVSDKLCPFATSFKLADGAVGGCKGPCLFQSGRAEIFPDVIKARTRKTKWYLEDKHAFIAQLKKDIQELLRKAKKRNMKAAVRLNGTSDILWERLIDFSEFPEVQFYDYTKVPLHFRKLAPNYHLTFSYSGTNLNECIKALRAGVNVAMVFVSRTMPTSYMGYKVIDGTEHDVRFLDKQKTDGAIIGLCPKGSKAKKQSQLNHFFVKVGTL